MAFEDLLAVYGDLARCVNPDTHLVALTPRTVTVMFSPIMHRLTGHGV